MIELKCEITPEMAEALEAAFCELVGCSPWSIFRKNKNTPYILYGYFEDETACAQGWSELRAQFSGLPEQPETQGIDDKDWQNAYKAFLKPWDSRGLHWVPVWMQSDYVLPEGAVCVWFDAGMAFGTGSHETTRLCAGRLLDFKDAVGAERFSQASIIDAGCGSGILAISASLLGAQNVYGFDRDPEAVRVSRENADYNLKGATLVEWLEGGLEDGLQGRKADLMLANIQADVLMIHAESLVEAMQPGGLLALSGVLAHEQEEVAERFSKVIEEQRGYKPKLDSRVMGEWCDILLRFE